MVRWVVRLVGLGILLTAVTLPGLLGSVGSDVAPAYEETTISKYVASFEVDDQGDLTVTERLTVSFPFNGKHGIFRFWDLQDPNDTGVRRVPDEIAVTRDGHDEPFSLSWENGRRYRVAKIGDANVLIPPGDHVYVLTYRIDGVLLAGQDADSSRFYWNLIPGGWQQSITRASLTVDLPREADNVQCAVGNGATGGCDVSGEDTKTLTIRASDLPPRTPVTVQTDLAMPTPPAGHAVPWPYALDGVLGASKTGALLLLALALGLGVLGWMISRTTHEVTPPFPLMYAPPDGVGPAQAQYLLTERVENEGFVASIMQAAEHGAVNLQRDATGWTLTDSSGAAGWAGLDAATRQVAGLLSGPGASFSAGRESVSAGKTLKSEMGQHESAVKSWARREGFLTTAGLGSWAGLLVLASIGLAGLLVFNPIGGLRGYALVPGFFGLGAIEVMGVGASTKRTAAGRDLWSRIGGFRRILSTPSAVERFDFSGRQELYTAYLPWAVAFGCAQEWADKYRAEMGAEPPTPPYFGPYIGGYGGDPTSALIDDFSSTVNAAISAYQATQSSSSSGGGGGFSGGGGGGGGGGGSW